MEGRGKERETSPDILCTHADSISFSGRSRPEVQAVKDIVEQLLKIKKPREGEERVGERKEDTGKRTWSVIHRCTGRVVSLHNDDAPCSLDVYPLTKLRIVRAFCPRIFLADFPFQPKKRAAASSTQINCVLLTLDNCGTQTCNINIQSASDPVVRSER